MINQKVPQNNSMLIDVHYVRANKHENKPDYLYVIWKDLVKNQKNLNVSVKEKWNAIYRGKI